ncbi:hypothetical protein [Actinopolymorpha alba]|uniref:hypothetical protein n=1 Tax=Actinopolymorpha alba TaxID=533267 RepID=UPI0003663367|nr:hypothetical protein [Actinopolymorpha alba]
MAMDGNGEVVDVGISSLWRERVGGECLAAALFEATTRAAFQVRTSSAAAQASALPPSLSEQVAAAYAAMPPEQGREAMYRTADLVRKVMTETTERLERLRAMNESQYAGTDERRRVTVVVLPSRVVRSITVDETWQVSVTTERLVNAVREAFRSAYSKLEAARADVAGEGAATVQLRTIISGSDGLRRWLREER